MCYLSIYKTFRLIKFAAQISMMAKLEASTKKRLNKVISKRALQRNPSIGALQKIYICPDLSIYETFT